MTLRLSRFAHFVAFVLVIAALAAPTAAAHHLGMKQSGGRGGDSSQPSGGIDGRVVAIAAVGLLGLGVGAAVAVGRRQDRLKGVAP